MSRPDLLKTNQGVWFGMSEQDMNWKAEYWKVINQLHEKGLAFDILKSEVVKDLKHCGGITKMLDLQIVIKFLREKYEGWKP